MNDFTASNGYTVSRIESGGETVRVRVLDPEGNNTLATGYVSSNEFLDSSDVNALREFFRAEEDTRLGRWRWPKSPNWVCYSTPRAYEVVVLNEAEPGYGSKTLERGGDTWPYYRAAADAYFAAHPEPKPWHDAKPGEGWVIEIGSEVYPNTQAVVVSNEGEFLFRDGGSIPVDHDYIRSGRRFHPEASS